MSVDSAPDDLAVVYGWTRRLCRDEDTAQQCAIEILRRNAHRQVPPWLHNRARSLTLHYLTIRVVLERRGLLGR